MRVMRKVWEHDKAAEQIVHEIHETHEKRTEREQVFWSEHATTASDAESLRTRQNEANEQILSTDDTD